MRFESVTSYNFGPFLDQTISFNPSMNVVWGPNEAGKSTWHSALYAGLCGIRRGRGQPRREDREFEARHRPWDKNDMWDVGAVVRLEDGRRIHLKHDLNGRVDASATDVDLAGRDYSNEVMFDGAPDGSRWLGLDRRSFLSTACIRQSDLLALLSGENAGDLQEQLQRAADTAGTDATAAKALQLLRSFHTENVGGQRATKRPLPSAQSRVSDATNKLEEAQELHVRYLDRRDQVESLEEDYQTKDRQAVAARCVLAQDEAERTRERLKQGRALFSRFPDGPPKRVVEQEGLRVQVATALQAWRGKPLLQEPEGPSVSKLRQELEELGNEAKSVPSEQTRGSSWLLLVALAATIGGGGLAITGLVVPGFLLFGVGLAGVVWHLMARQTSSVLNSRIVTPREERRNQLEQLIAARQREDDGHAEARRRGAEAERLLREVATSLGGLETTAEQQVRFLEQWELAHEGELKRTDQERQEWDELQRILGKQSLEDLESELERFEEEAEWLAPQVGVESLADARRNDWDRDSLNDLQQAVSDAREIWAKAAGELLQFAVDLPSVAEVEEELAAAREELGRIEQLNQTLTRTIDFLEKAEERVHRDIAPRLRASVLEWLSPVTGGRYSDCRIDPESLAVEVCGNVGSWRNAELLSHGAKEQVYLLLRLALTRHLTAQGEKCPLILDDVVAACDSDRKRQVLDTLLTISESSQVILFSHEDEVLSWAKERLVIAAGKLLVLDSSGIPA